MEMYMDYEGGEH